MFTLNCRGNIIIWQAPVVMGIINATPDSFYDGHISKTPEAILNLASKMISDGATIIDIGGQSTKPGSRRITAEEELFRVLPVVRLLRQAFPQILISIDTYHSAVAVATVAEGADIINDISAGAMDKKMIGTVAGLNVPYVCMHMQGVPDMMHQNPQYENVVKEVLDFFIMKIAECRDAGIKDLIIDPGFGFGKTITHNFQLLQQLSVFTIFEVPVLAGLSRKSTIYRTLDITAGEALNGTTVLNTIALQNGASVLRVHDVKEAAEAVRLFEAYKKPLPL